MESHPLQNKVYAIFDGPVREGNELTHKIGDVIEVIEKDNDEWWKGRMLKTRKVGYFRRNCVQEFAKELAEVDTIKVHTYCQRENGEQKGKLLKNTLKNLKKN